MKDFIIAFITASVSIMGFVLVEILFGRRTFNLLEKHDDRCCEHKNKLSGEHNNLSKEHSNLSKEHSNLSKEHLTILNNQKVLSSKQDKTSDMISKINNMLHEDKVDQKYLRENMNEHQKNMKESFESIEAIFDDWKKQIITVERLQERLHEREREIDRLEKENRELKRTRERERDYDRGR